MAKSGKSGKKWLKLVIMAKSGKVAKSGKSGQKVIKVVKCGQNGTLMVNPNGQNGHVPRTIHGYKKSAKKI